MIDKYGDTIIEENIDIHGNVLYRKVSSKHITDAIHETTNTYDAYNRLTQVTRTLTPKSGPRHSYDIYYTYTSDGKVATEEYVGSDKEHILTAFNYDQEQIQITRNHRSPQYIPMKYKQLELFYDAGEVS